MCPPRHSALPAIEPVVPGLATPQIFLSEIRMARPFHSIRNLEFAALRPSFAVGPPHDPFSSAPFGGSGHGEELLRRASGGGSPVLDPRETHLEAMSVFCACWRARGWE